MKNNKTSIKIEKFTSKKNQRNEYLVIDDDEVVLIDVCDTLEEVMAFLDQEGKIVKYILTTHAHPSHLQCIRQLKKKYEALFCVHSHEDDLLEKYDAGLKPDITLNDDMILPIGKSKLKVLHTPGHTKGSVCFYMKKAGVLFSGNTLLEGGHGKVWGPKSMSQIIYSLKRLNYSLPMDTTVYPIRGSKTTLRKEAWMHCLRSA